MRARVLGTRVARVAAAGLAVLGVASCSDEDSGGEAVSTFPPVTICNPDDAVPQTELPRVADIAAAIAAVEAELGGPAEFFEVNATPVAVNLFVALNERTVAQQYIWVDGELTSTEGSPAEGGTFTGSDLAFDPASVLVHVRYNLPNTILQTFYVNGDGNGLVQYAVLATAQCGGGLDIIVGPDGSILSVDAL